MAQNPSSTGVSKHAIILASAAILTLLILANVWLFGPSDDTPKVGKRSRVPPSSTEVDAPETTAPLEEDPSAPPVQPLDDVGVPAAVVAGGVKSGMAGNVDCGYISFLFCRFIDIDFIEFVLSSHPKPSKAKVVDIGVYQGGELVHMAKMGFQVDAYEPNPARFEHSSNEINNLAEGVRQRIKLRQNAVADRQSKLYFQRAGLDSHIYFPEDETKLKPHTIVVEGIPISSVVNEDKYFVKIDTQGFDTRIVDNLLDALEKTRHVVNFIQFEFSPFFEVSRAKRTKEDHKKVFRRLLAAGYDVYQGAAVQPWLKSHRNVYGKSPLAMLAPASNVPTCVDEFVEFMHSGREKPLYPGKTSSDIGLWMDVLAVRRVANAPYYRHTGWVLARKM